VHVARIFDIRYLWIDAPCTLQGDKRDWVVESSRTSEYFGNTAFTVVVVGVLDGTQGCFWPRNLFLTRPCRLSLHSRDELVSKDSPELFVVVAEPLDDPDNSFSGAFFVSGRSECTRTVSLMWLPSLIRMEVGNGK